MPKKKKTISRAKTESLRVKRRGGASGARRKNASRAVGRVVLPTLIIGVLLVGVGFLGHSAYQTSTASGFFKLRNIEINGVSRTSKEDIERIVTSTVEKPGVWKADLAEIRERVEKFPFVRSAAVSRSLPMGIRVNVLERVPAAVVHLSYGNYLVDTEGTLLKVAAPVEKDFPFILKGWDEAKTEKAVPDNLARLKLYSKMLEEWKQFEVAAQVKEVNLVNPREPIAMVIESGHEIAVTLAKDNYGKGLKTAIDALKGKGAKVKSVDAGGIYPVIQYIEF
ncbi:MAG: FtsQ-type POTRA domain-containing protein [Pyrinomonadaceae bacterium]